MSSHADSDKLHDSRIPAIFPSNGSQHDQDFQAFISELKSAILKKDVKFITAHVAENITWSFGADDKRSGFVQHWLRHPDESGLWRELGQVIALGCNPFQMEDYARKGHICPYVYTDFPRSMDAFENLVVIGNNVRVRTAADENARVLAKVNYEIVKYGDAKAHKTDCAERNRDEIQSCKEKCDWTFVELYSTKTRGYICQRFLRSPIDYRAIFEKVKGKWQITTFVHGD